MCISAVSGDFRRQFHVGRLINFDLFRNILQGLELSFSEVNFQSADCILSFRVSRSQIIINWRKTNFYTFDENQPLTFFDHLTSIFDVGWRGMTFRVDVNSFILTYDLYTFDKFLNLTFMTLNDLKIKKLDCDVWFGYFR